MMRMRAHRIHIFTALFGLVVLFGSGASAFATPTTLEIQLVSGLTTLICKDNDPCDTSALVGSLIWNTTIGGFKSEITVGTSKPQIGIPGLVAEMDLSDSRTLGGPGTVEIWMTDTGFTGPGGLVPFTTSWGGTKPNTGTVKLQTFVDNNDQPFGTTTPVSTLGPLTGQASFSGSNTVDVSVTPLYSMTLKWTVTHNAKLQLTTGDANLVGIAMPEPSALLLLGIGLIGLGSWRQGQRRKP